MKCDRGLWHRTSHKSVVRLSAGRPGGCRGRVAPMGWVSEKHHSYPVRAHLSRVSTLSPDTWQGRSTKTRSHGREPTINQEPHTDTRERRCGSTRIFRPPKPKIIAVPSRRTREAQHSLTPDIAFTTTPKARLKHSFASFRTSIPGRRNTRSAI